MAYGSVNVPGVSAPDFTAHTDDKTNPHAVTKAQVGLGNVDNTSDANKPVSIATQTALNGKADTSHTHSEYLSTTGTAAAATKLATDRTIQTNLASDSAASFNGTANVTPGVTGVLSTLHGGTGNTEGYIRTGLKSGTSVGIKSTAEGISNTVSGNYSHAEGNDNIVSGGCSHAEGAACTVNGHYAHAEGDHTTASENYSHAEGRSTTVSGACSHAEGYSTTASGDYCHAEGCNTETGWRASHAEGYGSKALKFCSHAEGYDTIANAQGQHVGGTCNVESTLESDIVIIGSGAHGTFVGDVTRSNCFRVTKTGVYASGNYNASGADYAELFEWLDGNPENVDRIGLFVTLDGEKIRLANADDTFILGVISGNPSVVGDVEDDQWRGMYEYDIYGRPLWEDVEIPDEYHEHETVNEDGETVTERVLIEPAHIERRQQLNPDYDSSQPYQKRTERKEWGCVGMMGKLVVNDDGSCAVNGWAKPGEGGVAVKSDAPTKYRVMSRIDDAHIRILIL